MKGINLTLETRIADVFDSYPQPMHFNGTLDITRLTAEKRILAVARPLLHVWPDSIRLRFAAREWGGDWYDAVGADINGAPEEYVHGHMSPAEISEDNPDATIRDYAEWLNTFLKDEFGVIGNKEGIK